ncbi:hypothetical protein GCM10009133_39690 [Cocleimonas flava]|uniref:Uncharacterized protein n=1 Tax=Cocleimonas flava TaxID=634765 RepID=A0A4R1F346_9GAMM|nr:hypothetical protein EV695_0033 [Cocleimonas flava]
MYYRFSLYLGIKLINKINSNLHFIANEMHFIVNTRPLKWIKTKSTVDMFIMQTYTLKIKIR